MWLVSDEIEIYPNFGATSFLVVTKFELPPLFHNNIVVMATKYGLLTNKSSYFV